MNCRRLPAVALVFAALVVAAPASAQDDQLDQLAPVDVLDLKLGEPVDAQPGPFREYACGTNGGPPAQSIASLDDFALCPPEPKTGLHEVTFRYDDEIEYYALAMNLMPLAERFGGTRFGTFPVIVSVLIGDDSVVHGYRVVTDDRVSTRERRMAYTMGILARSRVPGEWTCTDVPLGEGETAVGRLATKQDCTGVAADGKHMVLNSRYYRRKGQSEVDPHTGQFREGYFESTARLEVFDAEWKAP